MCLLSKIFTILSQARNQIKAYTEKEIYKLISLKVSQVDLFQAQMDQDIHQGLGFIYVSQMDIFPIMRQLPLADHNVHPINLIQSSKVIEPFLPISLRSMSWEGHLPSQFYVPSFRVKVVIMCERGPIHSGLPKILPVLKMKVLCPRESLSPGQPGKFVTPSKISFYFFLCGMSSLQERALKLQDEQVRGAEEGEHLLFPG
jgi:hypothetical protein